MENKTAQEYSVMILRRDKNHITALTTEDYDKAYEIWTEYSENWVKSAKELKVFKLEKPLVTAFDPALIYEIRIVPVTVSKNTRNNPYAEEMRTKGFSETFGAYAQGSDLLDGGYK